jgi:ABC-type multidrug transport system fused ATPase/permease subunit
MTMTNKWPFIMACFGMIFSSLASLILPIYYTKIVDVVQLSSATRPELVPVLMSILFAMIIVEIFSIL